jgi:tRNA 2-thiocytidine biosynthesis protein TtcA
MANPNFKKLTRLVGKAIGDFGLIAHEDRILIALSGGKDSWSLLYALHELQRKAPVKYDLMAITVDPGFPCPSMELLRERLDANGFRHAVVPGNIVEIVNENLTPGTNPCSFCSRLRRGLLYSYAVKERWNKIALGHHLDDFVETLLLNLFYNGSIKAMSPCLAADNGQTTVIRPLVYVRETLTRSCAQDLGVPIFGCSCAYQGMSSSKRHWIKKMLDKLEKDIPDVRSNLLSSLGRVKARHLFANALQKKT